VLLDQIGRIRLGEPLLGEDARQPLGLSGGKALGELLDPAAVRREPTLEADEHQALHKLRAAIGQAQRDRRAVRLANHLDRPRVEVAGQTVHVANQHVRVNRKRLAVAALPRAFERDLAEREGESVLVALLRLARCAQRHRRRPVLLLAAPVVLGHHVERRLDGSVAERFERRSRGRLSLATSRTGTRRKPSSGGATRHPYAVADEGDPRQDQLRHRTGVGAERGGVHEALGAGDEVHGAGVEDVAPALDAVDVAEREGSAAGTAAALRRREGRGRTHRGRCRRAR
jgi:hypothetical protein